MFCDQLLESVEAIAAGEMAEDADVAAHLESCAGCRVALAHAREVDRLLRVRRVPTPPEQFTAQALTRIRRQRWQSEQTVDAVFNATLVLIGIAIVAGIWALAAWTGLVSGSWSVAGGLDAIDSAVAFVSTSISTFGRQAAPTLPLYVAAVGLLASALALWWWAEGGAPN
jgi:predicted anti-sigma-YlaC factor YlaD